MAKAPKGRGGGIGLGCRWCDVTRTLFDDYSMCGVHLRTAFRGGGGRAVEVLVSTVPEVNSLLLTWAWGR